MSGQSRFSNSLDIYGVPNFSQQLGAPAAPANTPEYGSMANWQSPTANPSPMNQGAGGAYFIKNPENMSFWEKRLGGTDIHGNKFGGDLMPAISTATSIMGAYNAFQNMKTAKSALNFQKDAFSKSFENQRTQIGRASCRERV